MNYIDLGLSSKTLWADRNIGSEKPEDRGLLMEFGEWNNTYQIPTKKQFIELTNECTWTFIDNIDLRGYEVIGKNGNKIFLPSRKSFENGLYWSSSPRNNNNASYLYFDSGYKYVLWYERYRGLSVRPVKSN